MTTKRKIACKYAVLRFRPYPETGEFVNLGVAVCCPDRCFLEIQVENQKHARVTDFFPELKAETFKAARGTICRELERIQTMVQKSNAVELAQKTFREVVRPRETIFQFSEVRVILTEDRPDLSSLTKELFAQYVNRHFAQQKEYQETVMARHFLKALRKFRPDRIFHQNKKVGDGEYHVTIPICSDLKSRDGVPLRAIKPLDLAREDSTSIIEHGDTWIQRVRRLKAIEQLPERLIFAVRRPLAGTVTTAVINAATKVIEELSAEPIAMVDESEKDELVKLATE
jgi:hypothetical protein